MCPTSTGSAAVAVGHAGLHGGDVDPVLGTAARLFHFSECRRAMRVFALCVLWLCLLYVHTLNVVRAGACDVSFAQRFFLEVSSVHFESL